MDNPENVNGIQPVLWRSIGMHDARTRDLRQQKDNPEVWGYEENRLAYKDAYERESMHILLTGETSDEE